jgi:serine/threonine protein kinase
MQKIEEDERESLTARNRNEGIELTYSGYEDKKKKKKGKKKGKKSKGLKKENKKTNFDEENIKEEKKKSTLNNEMFILNTYQIIKMLGFGSFGEIHLAYETSSKQLRAIKFETLNQKNPQLKHEHNILEMLNRVESGEVPEGIPKVYGFEKTDRYSYMMMEFLGPSLSDLFQFCNKKFSLKTVCMLAIQMLYRIEYLHEKGFIHRDIKPENFVIGLNEKSNIVHIIDFGLSKRYKDRNTGQHIAYRENRQLVGTVRYASINAHLGIEQSRRDDVESIGYVLVYFLLGRLPWQSKDDKNKLTTNIMEKKLMTPPEILCKKLPGTYY